MSLKQNDLDFEFRKAPGPGGQHKNKTLSAVRLKHIPTGIVVNVTTGRCQHKNKETAIRLLKSKLLNENRERVQGRENSERKEQIGSGMRGDKIRTYSTKSDEVIDHRTGKSISIKKFYKGFIEELH